MIRQFGQEPLWLVQVRAVARVLDDRLAVAAAGHGVAVQHGPGLRHHGLRRPGLLAGPAGDRAERAQVGQVVQGGIGDDDVVGAAQPEHRRLGTGATTGPGECHVKNANSPARECQEGHTTDQSQIVT